jgi:hypothetical protein
MNYIYLMQYKRGRSCKIGISATPAKRLKTIDRNLKRGKVRLLVARKVPFADDLEDHLHEVFKARRFTFHAAGSGKREWFKLPLLHRLYALLLIELYYFAAWLIFFTLGILTFFGMYFFFLRFGKTA